MEMPQGNRGARPARVDKGLAPKTRRPSPPAAAYSGAAWEFPSGDAPQGSCQPKGDVGARLFAPRVIEGKRRGRRKKKKKDLYPLSDVIYVTMRCDGLVRDPRLNRSTGPSVPLPRQPGLEPFFFLVSVSCPPPLIHTDKLARGKQAEPRPADSRTRSASRSSPTFPSWRSKDLVNAYASEPANYPSPPCPSSQFPPLLGVPVPHIPPAIPFSPSSPRFSFCSLAWLGLHVEPFYIRTSSVSRSVGRGGSGSKQPGESWPTYEYNYLYRRCPPAETPVGTMHVKQGGRLVSLAESPRPKGRRLLGPVSSPRV